MVEAQDDNAVGRFAADGLEARYQLWNLPAVGAAHASTPAMAVEMDVKDTLSSGASVIRGLHRPGDGVTPDPSADAGIFDIFVVGDRVVAGQENQSAICERPHPSGHEAHALSGERVASPKVPQNFAVERAGQLNLDHHFSFAKPLR